MQELFEKTDNIIEATHKNTLFGLIAIVLSLLILISSIVIGFMTIHAVKRQQEETMTGIVETKKELDTYKKQTDQVLKELKKDNLNESQQEAITETDEPNGKDKVKNEPDEAKDDTKEKLNSSIKTTAENNKKK